MNKNTIMLHGKLGEVYGTDPITLYARDVPDIVKGLICMFGAGFKKDIFFSPWSAVIKDKPLQTEELTLNLEDEIVHIVPSIDGNITVSLIASLTGSLVTTTTAAGVTTSTAFGVIGGTSLAIADTVLLIASSVALSAISSAISSPKMNYANAEVERKPSFLYNGVVNSMEQGGAVPLIFGEHMAGSTVISVSMVSEEIGLRDNALSEEEVNFYGAISNQWQGIGATVSPNQFGSLVIEKTVSAGNFGGAVINLALEDNTEYRIYILALSYISTVTGLITYYDDMFMDVIDNGQVLGEAQITERTRVDLNNYTPEAMLKTYPSVTFTTLASQINPVLRIYPALSSPAGTTRSVRLVKVEKTRV